MIYWTLSTVSAFQLLGVFLLSFSILKPRMKQPSSAGIFSILVFLVPLLYLTFQSVKLPQYLSFISLGLTLVALYGYQIYPDNIVLLLSTTTILNLLEAYMFGGNAPQISPFWRHPLELAAVVIILGALVYRHYRVRTGQEEEQ